jgi:hypothetical protein
VQTTAVMTSKPTARPESPLSGSQPLGHLPGPVAVVGPYRLVRSLGDGPHGQTFEVEEANGARPMTLKLFSAQRGVQADVVAQLFRQTQGLRQIDNPHLVAPAALVKGDSGPRAPVGIVRDMLQGRSLARLLADEGPLPAERSITIGAQILDGLRAAHEAQVIHGNLKPENVFLTSRAGSDDYVRLVDFGAVDARASGPPADIWTDLSAFGAIVYRMLYGRSPSPEDAGDDGAVEQRREPPPTAPTLLAHPMSRRLDAIARRCLRNDPADRWPSTAKLKTVFDALLCEELVDVPGSTDALAQLPRARRRAWLTGAALGMLALAAAGAIHFRGGGGVATAAPGERSPPPAAERPAPAPRPLPFSPPAEAVELPGAVPVEAKVAMPVVPQVTASPGGGDRPAVEDSTSSRASGKAAKSRRPRAQALQRPTRAAPRLGRGVGREGTLNPFGD